MTKSRILKKKYQLQEAEQRINHQLPETRRTQHRLNAVESKRSRRLHRELHSEHEICRRRSHRMITIRAHHDASEAVSELSLRRSENNQHQLSYRRSDENQHCSLHPRHSEDVRTLHSRQKALLVASKCRHWHAKWLNSNSRRTLSSRDFRSVVSFASWFKNKIMVSAIVSHQKLWKRSK